MNRCSVVYTVQIMVDFPNIEQLDLPYNPFKCTGPLHAGLYVLSDCPHLYMLRITHYFLSNFSVY